MAYIMRKVFARAAINNTAVNLAADGCASNQTLMTDARSFVRSRISLRNTTNKLGLEASVRATLGRL
jgi:hypothetical protein